ncbi:MAG: type I-U CRISPR-associated protein Cas7 [Bauldia sp.]|nr:type I-U CRISPR-associated protein Cas7 [Bauldia sp.]
MTDRDWNALADEMLAANGSAALVCRQWLMPAEGRDAVIFPPTFAAAEGGGGKAGYNIDPLDPTAEKPTMVAIIDTVGSQANRMEPLFKAIAGEDPFPLVPQVRIRVRDGKEVDLLDAGHRAADALVRYSELAKQLHDAFAAYGETGDGRRSPGSHRPRWSSAHGIRATRRSSCHAWSPPPSAPMTWSSSAAPPNTTRRSTISAWS